MIPRATIFRSLIAQKVYGDTIPARVLEENVARAQKPNVRPNNGGSQVPADRVPEIAFPQVGVIWPQVKRASRKHLHPFDLRPGP